MLPFASSVHADSMSALHLLLRRRPRPAFASPDLQLLDRHRAALVRIQRLIRGARPCGTAVDCQSINHCIRCKKARLCACQTLLAETDMS